MRIYLVNFPFQYCRATQTSKQALQIKMRQLTHAVISGASLHAKKQLLIFQNIPIFNIGCVHASRKGVPVRNSGV